MSVMEVYHSAWSVVYAKNDHFKIDLDLENREQLEEIELGFASKSRRGVKRGVILTLGGCLIWKRNPGLSIEKANIYYCTRK